MISIPLLIVLERAKLSETEAMVAVVVKHGKEPMTSLTCEDTKQQLKEPSLAKPLINISIFNINI